MEGRSRSDKLGHIRPNSEGPEVAEGISFLFQCLLFKMEQLNLTIVLVKVFSYCTLDFIIKFIVLS